MKNALDCSAAGAASAAKSLKARRKKGLRDKRPGAAKIRRGMGSDSSASRWGQ